jgi:hypothetical protein
VTSSQSDWSRLPKIAQRHFAQRELPQALSLPPARCRFGRIDGPVRAAPRMREAAVFKTCAQTAVTCTYDRAVTVLAAHWPHDQRPTFVLRGGTPPQPPDLPERQASRPQPRRPREATGHASPGQRTRPSEGMVWMAEITSLQIAGIDRVVRLELGGQLPISNHGIPSLTGANGTLMAQRSCPTRPPGFGS